MWSHFNHPVFKGTLFFVLGGISGLLGCNKDEEAMVEVQADAAVKSPTYDLGPAVALPRPVAEVFRYMPEAPEGIRARPEDDTSALLKVPSVKKVNGFQRLYSESMEAGPFKRVQYVLSPDLKTVERVIATFHRQYVRQDRIDSIIEMISIRLGKPQEIKTQKTAGHRWSLPSFGVEVRKDLESAKFFSSQPLELIFDKRTRSERPL